MAQNLWGRILTLLGFEPLDEEFEQFAAIEDPDYPPAEEQAFEETAATAGPELKASKPRESKGALVSFPGGARGQLKVIVKRPESFDEVQQAADHLKSKSPVIVNLEHLDRDTAQQFVTFLSGTIYALNGEMNQLGTGIMMFTPDDVELDLPTPQVGDEQDVDIPLKE